MARPKTKTTIQDPETGETQMGGMGELHLDVLVTRLSRQFNVSAKKVCVCVCVCVCVHG